MARITAQNTLPNTNYGQRHPDIKVQVANSIFRAWPALLLHCVLMRAGHVCCFVSGTILQ